MISWQYRRNCTPAQVWMQLSMQSWHGSQHPSIRLLAALTMASIRRVVMSPRHRTRRGSAVAGSASASTTPRRAMASFRYSSSTRRKSAPAGRAGRTFMRERSSRHCSSSPSGTATPRYLSSSASSASIRYRRLSSCVMPPPLPPPLPAPLPPARTGRADARSLPPRPRASRSRAPRARPGPWHSPRGRAIPGTRG